MFYLEHYQNQYLYDVTESVQIYNTFPDMYNGNSISSSTEELFVRLDFEDVIKNLSNIFNGNSIVHH